MSSHSYPSGTIPLRVLLVSRPFRHVGGVRTSLEIFLRTLDPTRVQVQHLGVGKPHPHSPFLLRPFQYLHNLWSLWRTLGGVDLVHLNPSLNLTSLPLHLALMVLILLASRRPLLLHFRGWDPRIGHALAIRSWFTLPVRVVLARAGHIIVLAEGFRQQLVAAGLDPGRITVLPEMVELPDPTPARRSEERPVEVLFLSRLDPRKGAGLLIEAAVRCRERAPQIALHFTIAGGGAELQDLRQRVHAQGMDELIDLPGIVVGPAKQALFEKADLFIFPSRYPEGFPVAVLEAMACGLPLVYTRVGGLADALDEHNGEPLDAEALDAEQLGQAILELAGNSERRLVIGRHNREHAAQYEAHQVTARIEAIYRSLAAGGS